MATTAEHNAARNDNDLLPRLIASAEQAGIDNAQQAVEQNRGRIVAAKIDNGQGGQTTLADVHAYAVSSYQPTPRPGADAAKLRDDQIAAAIAAALGDGQP